MAARHFLVSLPLAFTWLLAACGGKVAIDASNGTGGGSITTTTTTGITSSTGTGTSGCPGEPFGCAQFCGSDFFPANADCINGAWQCPPGTVNPSTCPQTDCCSANIECGDEIFVPCVNGVCKEPLPAGGCWSDGECPGGGCVGAFVCPCGVFCEEPDHPGFCEGPP